MDWQVESGLRRGVFLSATSADLGECRRLASAILLQEGIFPIVQDHLGPDPRHLEELLLDKILSADAIICLVGHAFGASPGSTANGKERSYTQLEYDFAVRYEKPLFLFVATDAFQDEHPVNETEDRRALQANHRREILGGTRKYEQFSTPDELERLVRAAIRPILAHGSRRTIEYVHLPPSPACFVGRTDEAAQFDHALETPRPAVIAVLGMGGQGKTTLVARALHERKALPFAAGLWVSAERGGFTFSDFLDQALSVFMGPRFAKTDFPRVDDRVRKLLSLLQARPLLIVIDAIERWLRGWIEAGEVRGLQDLSLRQGVPEDLDRFLEEASSLDNGSHVILTSRALPSALDSAACAIVPMLTGGTPPATLQPLSPDAAVELLRRLGVVAPEEKLRELASSLVGHPLALTGFATLARKLGSGWETLIQNVGSDPSKAFHRLLDETRRHLPNRDAAEWFLKIAALCPEGARIEMLESMSADSGKSNPLTGTRDAILAHLLTLADWNLLDWSADSRQIRLHALVAEYFAELLAAEQRQHIHEQVSAWYESEAARSPARGTMERILALRHAVAAGTGKHAFDLLFAGEEAHPTLMELLLRDGHLSECAELLALAQGVTTELQKVHCILARAHILERLELSASILGDVHSAIEILQTMRSPVWAPVTVLLARCYGCAGNIHLETARATDAIPLYDKALALLDPLIHQSDEYAAEFAFTLSNRGLARLSRGEWDAAEDDYRQAKGFLKEIGDPGAASMLAELDARLASIDLDRGNGAQAITALEAAIEALRAADSPRKNPPERNHLATLVTLATACLLVEQGPRAHEILNGVVAAVEESSRAGSWEFNGVLAQAYVNQARTLLAMADPEPALHNADRAVWLYKDLIERGAAAFGGQLANALFKRAEARILTGDPESGREDLRRALDLSTDWIERWYGECNIQAIVIENGLHALGFLPDTVLEERRQILELLRGCMNRIAAAKPRTHANRREEQLLTQNWHLLERVATETDTSWPAKMPSAV